MANNIKIGDFVSIDKDGYAYKPVDDSGDFRVVEVIDEGGINAVCRITRGLEEKSKKEEKEKNAIGDAIYTQESCEKNKVA